MMPFIRYSLVNMKYELVMIKIRQIVEGILTSNMNVNVYGPCI